ncbi:Alpha/Beta hydrolase protein [Gongronella butleri]|nr:Alpha/Beta hydrolase protein [Gongronella butleri]
MLTFTYKQGLGGTYGDVDVYPNEKGAGRPLLVFLHGGAWRSEDKQDHTKLGQALCEQGFSVALPNYRLSLLEEGKPLVHHPAHIEDIAAALQFLHATPPVANAYDPSKMILVGHSAGAHIATMLLLDEKYNTDPYLAGIVGADGIYDLPLLLRTFPDYLDFISQAFGNDQEKYAGASPTQLPQPRPQTLDNVPVLLIHSPDDQLVDVAQTLAMRDRLVQLGVTRVVVDDVSCRGDHYAMITTPQFVRRVIQFSGECE